jgi:nitrite reductase/ring-hydroxylating ferredoxin subunit
MSETVIRSLSKVFAGSADDLLSKPCSVVHVEGHTLALFSVEGRLYAVDNRCPHMGFPLDRGSVKDGILTCYWHYARFDLASGGTFDLFADDVPAYPLTVEDGGVWIDLTPRGDSYERALTRLRSGLEHNITLVIAKAVIAMLDHNTGPADAFRTTVHFGAQYRRAGWGMGQTINAVMMNLLPYLDHADHAHALYQGMMAVAESVDGSPANFTIDPLPRQDIDLPTLKRWFRRFVEVRDSEGAERCLASAVDAGASDRDLTDIMFSAATDHRYLTVGHVADFTNKAFEALDAIGWDRGETRLVLTSLVPAYIGATRQEESNAWRYPVDLVALLEDAFVELPTALETGLSKRGTWALDPEAQVDVLLSDNPQATIEALLTALRDGATEEQLAALVTYAAIRRMAHFHVSNEFGDWDTVLHTLSYSNAIHRAIQRLGDQVSPEVVRGIFDAAMSVYLDRFLNIPAAPIPRIKDLESNPENLLEALLDLLDHQGEVDAAGELVARYLASGGDPAKLIATMGYGLVREDTDFHTIQTLEAAIQQFKRWQGTPAAAHALIAAARYLAAHTPNNRASTQTYRIARRFHRGERLFEG